MKQYWRVDSKIHTTSQWQVVVVVLWLFIMLLVMLMADLPWWQWLLMIAVTAGLAYLYNLRRLTVVHITQPEIKHSGAEIYYSPWLIYVASKQGYNQSNTESNKQLWQGYLQSSYANRYLLLLNFEIITPVQRPMTVMIWRDQINPTGWRQLQTLARLNS